MNFSALLVISCAATVAACGVILDIPDVPLPGSDDSGSPGSSSGSSDSGSSSSGSGSSGSSSGDGGSDPVVGCYAWFNGGVVQVLANGTLIDSGGGPTVSGTWLDKGGHNYTFNWSNGYTDTLILSGGDLSGTNELGAAITGTPTSCSNASDSGTSSDGSVGDAGSDASDAAVEHLVKVSGDGQVIPVGQYDSFVVDVIGASGSPVSGVNVAWQEPGEDARTYVAASNTSGQSSATQFVSSSAGSFTETAAIVSPSWTGGTGFITGPVPTVAGSTVTFNFSQ